MSLEKCFFFLFFFQIFAEIEMTQNETWLFGRHFFLKYGCDQCI